MIKYDPIGGRVIDAVMREAMQIAALAKDTVELTFNETAVTVYPSYETHLYREWEAQRGVSKFNQSVDALELRIAELEAALRSAIAGPPTGFSTSDFYRSLGEILHRA